MAKCFTLPLGSLQLVRNPDDLLQVSDARKNTEQTSAAPKSHYPSASNLFLPKKIADVFETELAKASKSSNRASASNSWLRRKLSSFFGDKSVKLVCMISLPFVLFWGVGVTLHLQLDYLVKVNFVLKLKRFYMNFI